MGTWLLEEPSIPLLPPLLQLLQLLLLQHLPLQLSQLLDLHMPLALSQLVQPAQPVLSFPSLMEQLYPLMSQLLLQHVQTIWLPKEALVGNLLPPINTETKYFCNLLMI